LPMWEKKKKVKRLHRKKNLEVTRMGKPAAQGTETKAGSDRKHEKIGPCEKIGGRDVKKKKRHSMHKKCEILSRPIKGKRIKRQAQTPNIDQSTVLRKKKKINEPAQKNS